MITDLYTRKAVQQNGTGSSSALKYQLGDRVQCGRFGTGVVRAYNPDGTLLVRFTDQPKSRSIFPSLLEKPN